MQRKQHCWSRKTWKVKRRTQAVLHFDTSSTRHTITHQDLGSSPAGRATAFRERKCKCLTLLHPSSWLVTHFNKETETIRQHMRNVDEHQKWWCELKENRLMLHHCAALQMMGSTQNLERVLYKVLQAPGVQDDRVSCKVLRVSNTIPGFQDDQYKEKMDIPQRWAT